MTVHPRNLTVRHASSKRVKLILVGYWFLYVASLLLLQAHARAWPTVYPSGTTLYDPQQAYNGYVLFCPVHTGSATDKSANSSVVSLMNMRGEVVHRWQAPFPVLHALLLPSGNIVMTGFNMAMPPDRFGGRKYPVGGATGWLVEQTWDGKTVFKHQDLGMHHDFLKLVNGHYIYMTWERVPQTLASKVLGGIKGSEFPDGTMLNDRLVEIDEKGKVVWEWRANEHLDPDIDIIGPLYKRSEWCHGNSISVLQDGNILLTSRSLDSMLVINRRSGKIASRWGSPSYLDKTSEKIEYRLGDEFLGAPHDAREIPAAYPGGGNITCYNNRMNTGDFLFSQVIEVDPRTRQVVWKSPVNVLGRRKYSDFLGSAQRLPNGNTLICNGADGEFIQMTPEYKIVWEYINPQIPTPMFAGAVFKARTYSPDYCTQFKELPPAHGAAIDLRAESTMLSEGKAAGTEPRFTYRYLPGIVALVVLVATSVWWRLRCAKNNTNL